MPINSFSPLGCGVGLRTPHYPAITAEWPKMDWFEAISENYMDSGGRPLHILEEVRRHYPLALHGVALSIGSTDPLNLNYLKRLKTLVDRIDPAIVSDHLCWSGVGGGELHDLLPLPFTEEAVDHVVRRVDQVQNFLGRPVLLENVSTYITYRHSTMPEWAFLAEVVKRSGCGILLDLNNIYVNAKNHGFDPIDYLNGISASEVGQIHLAGHTDMGKFLFDTHSAEIIDPVWDLYREVLRRWGKISTLIEWDEKIPEFSRLAEEAARARRIYEEIGKNTIQHHDWVTVFSGKTGMTKGALDHSPSLHDVQRWMKSQVVPDHDASSNENLLSVELNPQGGDPGEARLAIYRGGYLARITESLNEVYEATARILGNELFSGLCHAYAHSHASHSYNLTNAGDHFAEFLVKSPVSEAFPWLPDLARFEWQISAAFHAWDVPPMDPESLKTLNWENAGDMHLIFQPSVSLLSSEWDLVDLWELRKQMEPRIKSRDFSRRQDVLISRRGLQVRCEKLDPLRFLLLKDLLAGKTIGEALDALLEEDEETMPPLSAWFSRWVQDGLVVGTSLAALSHQ